MEASRYNLLKTMTYLLFYATCAMVWGNVLASSNILIVIAFMKLIDTYTLNEALRIFFRKNIFKALEYQSPMY